MDSYEVSLKKDIVPAISEKLGRKVDPRKLFTLSVDALDLIFGYLFQEGNVAASEIVEILNSSNNDNVILQKLQQAAQSAILLPEDYDESEDLIAGIMVGIHADYVGNDMKEEIENRLRRVNDLNKLVEYSQMSIQHLQVALGIRPPMSPSLAGGQGLRTARQPPPLYSDTDSSLRVITPEHEAAPAVPFVPTGPPREGEAPSEEPEEEETSLATDREKIIADTRNRLQHRREEIDHWVGVIKKLMKKNKFDLGVLAPEFEIIDRTHPDRLERIAKVLQKSKKNRAKLIFDWLVISQEIEEIDVLVTHWQGIVGGSGAFEAAIPFARYDAMLEDMSTRLLETFLSRARKAVYEIQNATDINDRIIGVEEIKELAADLMRKALYG